MNLLFVLIILFSLLFAIINGRMPQLSEAAMSESANAVSLVLSLMGMMCLWSGLMKVAQQSRLTEKLSLLLSPITKRLFKDLNPKGKAMEAISMNIVANLLGLGNAATPLGIKAMCEMSKETKAGSAASNSMVMFVVLNTAAIQLIPTTTAMLRMNEGSTAPLDIQMCIRDRA